MKSWWRPRTDRNPEILRMVGDQIGKKTLTPLVDKIGPKNMFFPEN